MYINAVNTRVDILYDHVSFPTLKHILEISLLSEQRIAHQVWLQKGVFNYNLVYMFNGKWKIIADMHSLK